MSWIGLIYYPDRIENIGGSAAEPEKEIHYKIKKYVKRGCQRVKIYRTWQTIYPAGIRGIKKHQREEI